MENTQPQNQSQYQTLIQSTMYLLKPHKESLPTHQNPFHLPHTHPLPVPSSLYLLHSSLSEKGFTVPAEPKPIVAPHPAPHKYLDQLSLKT